MSGIQVGAPRDPGVQVERTSLAWQRTILSACGVAALVLRYEATHGPLTQLLGGAGLAVAAGFAVWLWLGRRFRLWAHFMASGSTLPCTHLPGAGPMLVMAIGASLFAITGLVNLVTQWRR